MAYAINNQNNIDRETAIQALIQSNHIIQNSHRKFTTEDKTYQPIRVQFLSYEISIYCLVKLIAARLGNYVVTRLDEIIGDISLSCVQAYSMNIVYITS